MKTTEEILESLEYIKRLHNKNINNDYSGLIDDELKHSIKLVKFLIS